MKTVIHVNQSVIRKNLKEGTTDPALTCKTYKDNRYGHEAIVKDKNGEEVGRFIYSPNKPLSCGARLWFETQNEVEVITHDLPPMPKGHPA